MGLGENGIERALALGPIYNDGTYKYIGEADPGTLLDASSWRIQRISLATTQIQWANVDSKHNANFDNVFTDVGTVAALTYT